MANRAHKESNGGPQNQAGRAEASRNHRSEITPNVPVVPRPVRRYRARVFQGYLVAATVGFGLLFFYARKVAYFRFDLTAARWVQHWHTFSLDVVMQSISELGYTPLAPIFVALTILFFYLVGFKWEAVMLGFGAVFAGVLNAGIKIIVQRHRPTADLVNVFSVLNDYSFPSGHVLLFTVFLGFLLFLIYTLSPRSWGRTSGLGVLGALIALVGLSRVYLGQHWPSDVLGAYLLGSLWLVLTVFLYRKGKPRFFVNQPLAPETPK
jgi:membrane-associated phospholipid phosphatase